MTPSRMLRPVLVCLSLSGVGLTTASCGMVDGDPHRFESLATKVADIRLDGSTESASTSLTRTAAEDGLRPAVADSTEAVAGHKQGLRVEVMDPHDLWDARDGLRRTIRDESAAVVEKAAPMVAHAVAGAVVQQVSARVSEAAHPLQASPSRTDGLRPAFSHASTSGARTTIQLGAYSSEAAARSAWTAVSTGAAEASLKGLSPVFERATVNGRTLTRLKVAAPTTAAAAICRAARVSDPWCARRA
jgi:hypothetical protein